MAKSSAKKVMKSNARRLTTLKIVIGITNVVYGIVRMGMFRGSFTIFDKVGWAILGILYGLPFYTIWTAARPAFDKDGDLIHGGEDVSKAGVLEYAHDVIYVCAVTQLGMTLTRWASLLLLVIPAYGGYLAFSSGLLSSPTADASIPNDDGGALASMSRKERRKAERQSRKQQ